MKPTNKQLPRKASSRSKAKTLTTTTTSTTTIAGEGHEPFPSFAFPTADQCRAVRDSLLSLHGFPPEFAEFRRVRLQEPDQPLSGSVLYGLVATLLSQNTTDGNSRRAFLRLKAAFPTWPQGLHADPAAIQDAIRCGGLARTKAARIKSLLATLKEKKGDLCLDYVRGLSVDEVKSELAQFKGIGPKTVACVLMFYLHKDDFPVDTHVFQITKGIGWVSRTASRETAYLHLNARIPDELKFDLNCLFVTHSKVCRSCKQQDKQTLKKPSDLCPLVNYSNVHKQEL